MQTENYILAMYDVRGKQDFIYRSNKCKEIVGGSRLIADVFRDYLFPAAKQFSGLSWDSREEKIYAPDMQRNPNEGFSVEKFEKRIKDGYVGEVVYEGGGNFFVLYKDKDTCIKINRIFTKNLLEKVGTLHVLCTYIEGLHFDDYQWDQRRLRKKHQIHEAQESISGAVNTTPFTAVSPDGSRPYTDTCVKVAGQGREKVTTEQLAKYTKYKNYISSLEQDVYDKEEYLLDNMVTKRGEESLLAVIYIDGNGMGAKVAEALKEEKSYDECVSSLRKFSEGIDRDFVRNRIADINHVLEEKHAGDKINDKVKARRTIVAAGDEMTIICNARDALDVVKAYFRGLPKNSGSSCAGVAIFHSHSPYADAYRIAEECCENAKTVMKKAEVTNVNLMDFHYCQGGTGISLESIRHREGTEDVISRPWRLDVNEATADGAEPEIMLTPVCSIADLNRQKKNLYENAVNRMVAEWREKELARSNIKVLRDASLAGAVETGMEIKRINAHRTKEKGLTFDISERVDKNSAEYKEYQRRLIYDISLVYDLWFRGEQQG